MLQQVAGQVVLMRRSLSSPTFTSGPGDEEQHEVFVVARPFTNFAKQLITKLSPEMRDGLVECGICHYMVVLRDRRSGKLTQFDFGPKGGDVHVDQRSPLARLLMRTGEAAPQALSSQSGGPGRGAHGEVREELLAELPQPHVYVGSTSLSLDEIRAYNSVHRPVYQLHENDCRHYVNSLVQYATGFESSTVHLLRQHHRLKCVASPPMPWVRAFVDACQYVTDVNNWPAVKRIGHATAAAATAVVGLSAGSACAGLGLKVRAVQLHVLLGMRAGAAKAIAAAVKPMAAAGSLKLFVKPLQVPALHRLVAPGALAVAAAGPQMLETLEAEQEEQQHQQRGQVVASQGRDGEECCETDGRGRAAAVEEPMPAHSSAAAPATARGHDLGFSRSKLMCQAVAPLAASASMPIVRHSRTASMPSSLTHDSLEAGQQVRLLRDGRVSDSGSACSSGGVGSQRQLPLLAAGQHVGRHVQNAAGQVVLHIRSAAKGLPHTLRSASRSVAMALQANAGAPHPRCSGATVTMSPPPSKAYWTTAALNMAVGRSVPPAASVSLGHQPRAAAWPGGGVKRAVLCKVAAAHRACVAAHSVGTAASGAATRVMCKAKAKLLPGSNKQLACGPLGDGVRQARDGACAATRVSSRTSSTAAAALVALQQHAAKWYVA